MRCNPERIRQTAALLYAADMMWFEEHDNAQLQLDWCKAIFNSTNEEPWANGKHSGACTKQCYTCNRCILEEYEARAVILLSDDGE